MKNKILLILVLGLICCLSTGFASAILVDIGPTYDKIGCDDEATFTCTIYSTLPNMEISYEVWIEGTNNPTYKKIDEGTTFNNSFQKSYTITDSDFANGEYDIECIAVDDIGQGNDASHLDINCSVPICDDDGWFCSADEERQYWNWYWNGNKCVYDVTQQVENCNTGENTDNHGDGCYTYSNGCEERDYFCVEGIGGSPCDYDRSNRNTDKYGNYIDYCKNDDVYEHRLFYDYYCDGNYLGNCVEDDSWVNDGLVEDCGVDGCSEWANVCGSGNDVDLIFSERTCYDKGCSGASCFNISSIESSFVKDCNDFNGWTETGNTKWVINDICTEKELKERKYRDYTCSDEFTVECSYIYTSTEWIETGNTRNVVDGTVCNDGQFCTDPDVCTAGVCGGDIKDCGDGVGCTVDSCNEVTDSCDNNPDDTLCSDDTFCADYFCSATNDCQVNYEPNSTECRADAGICDIPEYCTGDSPNCPADDFETPGTDCGTCAECDVLGDCVYDSSQDGDCSDTICIDDCSLIPDGNPYTWDYASDVPNYCVSKFTCSENTCDYDHECSVDNCDAECDIDHPCADTPCKTDKCIGPDWYDYPDDVPNSCLGDCSCEDNKCAPPQVSYNDPRCTECQDDSDCNYLDRDYCTGDIIKHDEGICNDEFECEAVPSTVYDCNILDTGYCNSNLLTFDDYTCNATTVTCVLEDKNETDCHFFEETCKQDDVWYEEGFCNQGLLICDSTDGYIESCDNDYETCSGTERLNHDEYCSLGACTTDAPSLIYDCADNNYDECSTEFNTHHYEETCSESFGLTSCIPDLDVVLDCRDDSWCNGQETCTEVGGVQCINATEVDCSPYSFGDKESCNENPDTLAYTWDVSLGFESECVETDWNQGYCTEDVREWNHTCADSDTNDSVPLGGCNAECDEDSDCDDDNPFTLDWCNFDDGCGCEHNDTSYCGDGIINPATELCDNGTLNGVPCIPEENGSCTYCTEECGIVTKYDGYCGDGKLNVESWFTSQSPPVICPPGEPCSSSGGAGGGGGSSSMGEECELPNTNNNTYCNQTTTTCEGALFGVRDLFGTCDSECGCIDDPFEFACVIGECGASCSLDSDCNDENSSTTDTCNLTSCACEYEEIPPTCGDGIVNQESEQCEPSNTTFCDKECQWKELTCIEAKDLGLIQGKDVSITGASATVYNYLPADYPWSYNVGLAVYEKYDEDISHQEIFDFDTGISNPNTNETLNVSLPECKYQIDLFCGDVLQSLDCNEVNPCRYKNRLIDWEHTYHEYNEYCGPVCGNDVLEEGEECDDGNLINGDGCDSTCSFEGDCIPRTIGYWGQPCKGHDMHENASGIESYLVDIHSMTDLFDDVTTFEDACEILLVNDSAVMMQKAKQQLLASWLNIASGKIHLHSTMDLTPLTNATVIQEILSEAEALLLSDVEKGKNIADEFNNGAESVIECIPDDCFYVTDYLDFAKKGPECGGANQEVTAKALFSDDNIVNQGACGLSPAYIYLDWYNVSLDHLVESFVYLEHKEVDVYAWVEYHNGDKWIKVCDLPVRTSETVDNCELNLEESLDDINLRIGIATYETCHEELDQGYIKFKYCYYPDPEPKVFELVSYSGGGGGGGGGSSYDDSKEWDCVDTSKCIDGEKTQTCSHKTRIGTTKKVTVECTVETSGDEDDGSSGDDSGSQGESGSGTSGTTTKTLSTGSYVINSNGKIVTWSPNSGGEEEGSGKEGNSVTGKVVEFTPKTASGLGWWQGVGVIILAGLLFFFFVYRRG